MIIRYAHDGRRLSSFVKTGASVERAVWIDLDHPDNTEIKAVEAELGIDIPSADDMREIEVSSRLYHEDGAHFMTTSLVYRIETPQPVAGEVTFILTNGTLVTVRFSNPRGFVLFSSRASAGQVACGTPAAIAIGLIEAIVEREADLIERLQSTTEEISHGIFELRGSTKTRAKRHAVSLKEIGQASVIASRTRDALVSQGRLLTYFQNVLREGGTEKSVQDRVRTTLHDVTSLSAHLDHLTTRLTFLLEATIGLVGVEQNQIIKLFSVVAVMLMPPTLIASVYGMNFHHMPELDFVWGYPLALVAMVVSAVLPFVYFKQKGWL